MLWHRHGGAFHRWPHAEPVVGQAQGAQLGRACEQLGERGEVAVVDLGQRYVGGAVPSAHEEGERLLLLGVARCSG